MNEIIWETDLESQYHVQVIKTDTLTILLVKRISDNQVILEQPVESMVSGSVSTMDIIKWVNLAKTAIEKQQ